MRDLWMIDVVRLLETANNVTEEKKALAKKYMNGATGKIDYNFRSIWDLIKSNISYWFFFYVCITILPNVHIILMKTCK